MSEELNERNAFTRIKKLTAITEEFNNNLNSTIHIALKEGVDVSVIISSMEMMKFNLLHMVKEQAGLNG
jgi:transcriptional regulator